MNSRRKKRSMMTTRMVRAIAILFLIYTGVEITSPQFCAEASGALSISEATPDCTTARGVSATTDNDQEKLPSEQPCPDEDCFCCCAHVVPGRGLAVMGLSDRVQSFRLQRKIDLPSPPLQSPYHPPRFA